MPKTNQLNIIVQVYLISINQYSYQIQYMEKQSNHLHIFAETRPFKLN